MMTTSSRKVASCRRRPLSLWMVSFLAILFTSFCCLVAGQENFSIEELQGMADAELEHICIARGFELVKDDVDEETGEIYTLSHDDFVEAAQRCLAIEEEMNEILAEHPELAEELEAEIARMEEEQAQKQAEVQRLQHELEEKNKSSVPESSGAAFVPKPRSPEASQTTGTLQDNVEEETVLAEDNAKPVEEETVKAETVKTPRQEASPSASSDGSEAQMEEESSKESKEKEDLTLSALSIEIIRRMFKDTERELKRIIDLILPVVRPVMNAGDVAWRHIKATLISLKKDFDRVAQQKQEEQRQESGEAAAE